MWTLSDYNNILQVTICSITKGVTENFAQLSALAHRHSKNIYIPYKPRKTIHGIPCALLFSLNFSSFVFVFSEPIINLSSVIIMKMKHLTQ